MLFISSACYTETQNNRKNEECLCSRECRKSMRLKRNDFRSYGLDSWYGEAYAARLRHSLQQDLRVIGIGWNGGRVVTHARRLRLRSATITIANPVEAVGIEY